MDRYERMGEDGIAAAFMRDGEAVPQATHYIFNFIGVERSIINGQEALDNGSIDDALQHYWHVLESGRNADCGELNPARDMLVDYAASQINRMMLKMEGEYIQEKLAKGGE